MLGYNAPSSGLYFEVITALKEPQLNLTYTILLPATQKLNPQLFATATQPNLSHWVGLYLAKKDKIVGQIVLRLIFEFVSFVAQLHNIERIKFDMNQLSKEQTHSFFQL